MIMIWRWIFLHSLIWQQLVAKLENDEEQQPVVTISEDVFFTIPWRYHLYIISQCKDVDRVITLYSSASLSLLLCFFLFILSSFCERIRHNTCHILERFIVRITQMIIGKIANDLGSFKQLFLFKFIKCKNILRFIHFTLDKAEHLTFRFSHLLVIFLVITL